jgi:hypothetical protein
VMPALAAGLSQSMPDSSRHGLRQHRPVQRDKCAGYVGAATLSCVLSAVNCAIRR